MQRLIIFPKLHQEARSIGEKIILLCCKLKLPCQVLPFLYTLWSKSKKVFFCEMSLGKWHVLRSAVAEVNGYRYIHFLSPVSLELPLDPRGKTRAEIKTV